jgi:hypothetical protein
MTTMSDPEKDRANALMAACIQAAATLKASTNGPGSTAALNVEKCTKLARELFEDLTGTPWP